MTRREAAWRHRNPDLAARFDRLPAASKANIRTGWASPGTFRGASKAVRQADEVRRERVRERSAARRQAEKARREVTGPVAARREAVYRRMVSFYGMGPEYAANLRHNLTHADPVSLRRLEEADNDGMRRLVAAQLPDGATTPFHYHTRMA